MASSLKNALLLGSLLVLVLACLAGPTAGASLGDRLLRTFFVFAELPLTAADAEAQGWTRMWGPCNPNIGYTYAQTASGATSWSPVLLYFTAAGQLSGFGVHATGWEPQYLVDRGFFTPTGLAQQYDIFIRTRDAKYMCSGEKSFDLLGDRLEINGFFPIPLNMSTAVKQGWAPGNCIGQMGIHYAYDLAAFGKNTWNASTLVPVMPMYDAERQTINAILFNLPHLEFGEPLGMFEGPLSTGLFCKNWCADSGCTFDIGGRSWSTMHFHFVDPSSISCSGAPCTLF